VLSVIIPTRMRPELVLRTLASLAEQDLDPDTFEVVVVADGCERGTAEAVRAADVPFRVIVHEQAQAGIAGARNAGTRVAAGDQLVFMDDDMLLDPAFLRHVSETLTAGADVALTDVRLGDWVRHTVTTAETRRWEAESHAKPSSDDVPFDEIHFWATGIRRSALESAGGFDEAFTAGGAYGNEDIELGHRLLGAGADVRWARGARADTEACVDADELLERTTHVGRNDVRLARLHPELGDALLGRKLRDSRVHRAVARLLLAVPVLARLDPPLRWGLRRVVRTGADGPVAYRIWFTARAVRYWDGVLRTDGSDLVRALLRAS
jgi:glycosyltransferase involved in cell wall biosynthesis